jgi:hypothetical protein
MKRNDRDYHNQSCTNYAIVALLLMPYALVRYGWDLLRGRG